MPIAQSLSSKALVVEALQAARPMRVDGRGLMVGRAVSLTLRRHEGSASAELTVGRTRVLATVTGEIVQPFPDRPSEGILVFNVELSPMASEAFETGRPSPAAVELTRIGNLPHLLVCSMST